MSASIRHLLSRQESSLPIKLIAPFLEQLPFTFHAFLYDYAVDKSITANRIRIGTHRLEDERSTINLWP